MKKSNAQRNRFRFFESLEDRCLLASDLIFSIVDGSELFQVQSDEAGSQATVQLIEGQVPAAGRHEIQIEVSKKGFDRPLTTIDFAAYFPSEQILRDLGTGRTTLARQNQNTLDQSAVDNVLQRYSSAPNAPFDAGRLTTEVSDLANVVRSTIDSPANETAVRRQVYNAIRQLDRSLANQRGNSLSARNTSAKQTADELGQLGAMLMDTIQVDMESSNQGLARAAADAWRTLQSFAKTSWVTWNGLGVNSEPVDLSANAGQRHWSAIYEVGALEIDSFLSVDFGQPALVEAEFQVHSAVAAVARQAVQEDAYVYNQNATANFGSADSLTVANTQMGSISIQMESYLSFDLTGYSPNLDSLTLTLQPNDVTGNPTNAIAHVTYGDWSENSITWNNRPTQVGSAIQTWQPVEGVAQTIDLTNVARKVLRQGDVNFDNNVSFWGSEGDMAAFELAIKNPSAYQSKFGSAVSSATFKERADLNGDGAVNLYDFDPVFYGGTPTYDGFIQSHGVLLADLNLDGMVTSEDLDGLTYQGSGVSYFEGDIDLDDDYDVFDYIRIFVEIDENAQAIPVQANPPRQLDLKLYSPTTSPTLQPVTYPSGELSAAEIEVSGPIVVPTVFQVGDSTTPYKDIFRLTVSGPTTVSLDNREPDGIAGGILPSYQTFNLEADNVYDVSVEHIGHEGTSPVNYSWNADVSPQSFDGEMQGVGAILIDSSPSTLSGLNRPTMPTGTAKLYLPTVTITPVNTTSVVQYIDNGVKRDAFVAISNRDDDDQDAVLDIADSKVEGGDDNLVQMTVSPVSLPALQALPGRTILTFDGGVRVWTSPEKTAATKLTSPAILPHNAPSTIYVEAIATAGYSSIRATYELDDMVNLNGGFANPAFHKVTFATWTFDYDADSDNTDGFNYPQNSAWEEHLEDHPYGLGKLVMQNYNTSDPASHFTPTRLRLPAGLDPNDSQIRVRIDFAPGSAAGNIELWTLPKAANRINAAANEGGDKILPGGVYKLSELRYSPNDGGVIIYIAGIDDNDAISTYKGVEANGRPNVFITTTLVVNGADAAVDEIKYIVTDEESFFYSLRFWPEVRHGLVAKGVYEVPPDDESQDLQRFSMKLLKTEDLEDMFIPPETIIDITNGQQPEGVRIPGFTAALYRDYLASSSDVFILGFAGTNDLDDLLEDIVQGVGLSTLQYPVAMRVSHSLGQMPLFQQNNISLAGHSLGGGLASAGAVASGFPAMTFNAAGLGETVLYRDPDSGELVYDANGNYVEQYPGSLTRFNNPTNITQYFVDYDILTVVQELTPMPNAIGYGIKLDGPYDLAIAIDIAHISIGVATGNPWHVIGGGLMFGVELGECHLMDAVLYGLLVEENLVGGIDVDRFGIGQ